MRHGPTTVETTSDFSDWLDGLRDRQARTRVVVGIERLASGLGNTKPLGEGVSELRIHYGPGYRVYFTRQGEQLIILLIGGDKRQQSKDVAKAKELAALLE
jgi:putative addiction module killer protein